MISLAVPAGASRDRRPRIRPLSQRDLAAYYALLESLSPADVRARFHSASIPSPAQVREMLFGPAALGAVLAETRAGEPSAGSRGGELLGVAHAARERTERRGEFGILVAAAHRRKGLGGGLTDALLALIASRGTAEAVAYTAWENVAAAALLRSRGFVAKHDGAGTVRWVLPIAGSRAS
jgi:ribosomal protein S18 acetylase RimI-like enzyme